MTLIYSFAILATFLFIKGCQILLTFRTETRIGIGIGINPLNPGDLLGEVSRLQKRENLKLLNKGY